MRAARFSILVVKRRHEVAGLIVTDLFRRTEAWPVDLGLESSIPEGSMMATRLFTAEGFSMTVLRQSRISMPSCRGAWAKASSTL
jgi:hypothetical protein